jgi:large subunit ribosomal protein L34e
MIFFNVFYRKLYKPIFFPNRIEINRLSYLEGNNMSAPRFRSRSLRRVHKVTPGGKTKKYHIDRKPNVPKCAECKKSLKGIPRMLGSESKNAPKSAKKVSRAYGGFMCATCLRKKLKQEIRATN